MEIALRVRKTLANNLCCNLDSVLPESHITDDLGADSLDTIELAIALEDEFDVDIDDTMTEKLDTVQDYIDFIERIKNHKG